MLAVSDKVSESAGAANALPTLTTTVLLAQERIMADIQPTAERPFFQPREAHNSLNAALLLWRIAERVTLSPSGCWLWTGNKTAMGYGRVSRSGRNCLVHRLIYELCVADVPSGIEVCHDCPGGDNPACCNPAHLFLGTHTDNMADAVRKGRIRTPRQKGESHSQAKITDEIVRAVRRRSAAGEKGSALARELHLSRATISEIVSRKKWPHVTDEPEGGVA